MVQSKYKENHSSINGHCNGVYFLLLWCVVVLFLVGNFSVNKSGSSAVNHYHTLTRDLSLLPPFFIQSYLIDGILSLQKIIVEEEYYQE